MKKPLRYFAIATAIIAVLLTLGWLILPSEESVEIRTLQAEGWTIVPLDLGKDTSLALELSYWQAATPEAQERVQRGGALFQEDDRPAWLAVKVTGHELLVFFHPEERKFPIDQRSFLQQLVDLALRGIPMSPTVTVHGKQTITFHPPIPKEYMGRLLNIPSSVIPFDQEIEVVEWSPKDNALPVQRSALKIQKVQEE